MCSACSPYVAYTGTEQHGEGDRATSSRSVAEQKSLPLRDEAKIRFTIAQLLRPAASNWPETVIGLAGGLAAIPPASRIPVGIYLMALAYFQMGRVRRGDREDPKQAIALARRAARELVPDALRRCYISEKQDFESPRRPSSRSLLLRFPKKQYWIQLSLIYGAKEDHEISLAVQQMAYDQGLLTEDKELRRLARSYLYRDLPYPAAKVLESEIKGGRIEGDSDAHELLANSWIAAREFDRSLPPLQKAADLSEDGNLYVRLAQVHMQREEWGEAAQKLEAALEKGELKDRGNAVLLAGIAHYNDSQAGRARSYFARARGFESTRAEANRWIAHLAAEAAQEGPG